MAANYYILIIVIVACVFYVGMRVFSNMKRLKGARNVMAKHSKLKSELAELQNQINQQQEKIREKTEKLTELELENLQLRSQLGISEKEIKKRLRRPGDEGSLGGTESTS